MSRPDLADQQMLRGLFAVFFSGPFAGLLGEVSTCIILGDLLAEGSGGLNFCWVPPALQGGTVFVESGGSQWKGG